jgi:hypothetical protein
VDLAGVQRIGDVGGRQQPHLRAGQALQAREIAAGAAGDLEAKPAVGQPFLDLFLEPALGRDRDHQPAHASPPA